MPHVSRTSPGGITSSYRYEVGRVVWDGQDATVVVIDAFPIGGGNDAFPHASVQVPPLRDLILDQNPELKASSKPLTFVIRRPALLPFPRWELVSTWPNGRGPDLRIRSNKITSDLAAELERAFLA
jgi:hypothetical protein